MVMAAGLQDIKQMGFLYTSVLLFAPVCCLSHLQVSHQTKSQTVSLSAFLKGH